MNSTSSLKKGMIKLSILYPAGEGKIFNIDYYANNHMPLVKKLLGNSLMGTAIDKGLSGIAPDSPATYVAIGSLYFESLETMQEINKYSEQLMADIPNYTNIEPIIQISEVHSA